MSEDVVTYDTVLHEAEPNLEVLLTELDHPDPDVEGLPLIPDTSIMALQADTAGRLLRAVVKAEASIEQLETRMKADMAAWQALIARHQQRVENWRAVVKSWMERTGTTKLQTPWMTASLVKGRTRIVVDDEVATIQVCKEMGAGKAVKITERLVKAELDIAYNSRPGLFGGVAHEEQSEPSLRIQKR